MRFVQGIPVSMALGSGSGDLSKAGASLACLAPLLYTTPSPLTYFGSGSSEHQKEGRERKEEGTGLGF